MPPVGFFLRRRMRRQGSFVESRVRPLGVVEVDPIFDHAFGLAPLPAIHANIRPPV